MGEVTRTRMNANAEYERYGDGALMQVCAIAYNGGTVPPRPMYFIGDSMREDDLK